MPTTRKNYGQINDHQGNSIAASRDMRMLFDAGWRIARIKYRGMMKQVWWYSLRDEKPEAITQGAAVEIEKARKQAAHI